MNQKKQDYKVMSDETCKCGKAIKLNVAARIRRRPLDCFKCYVKKHIFDGYADY